MIFLGKRWEEGQGKPIAKVLFLTYLWIRMKFIGILNPTDKARKVIITTPLEIYQSHMFKANLERIYFRILTAISNTKSLMKKWKGIKR